MSLMDSAELAPVLQSLSVQEKEEVAQLLQHSQQQAQVVELINNLTATCFKTCVAGKISTDTLSSTEQSCAQNCVGRWIEVQGSILKNLSAQQGSARGKLFG